MGCQCSLFRVSELCGKDADESYWRELERVFLDYVKLCIRTILAVLVTRESPLASSSRARFASLPLKGTYTHASVSRLGL